MTSIIKNTNLLKHNRKINYIALSHPHSPYSNHSNNNYNNNSTPNYVISTQFPYVHPSKPPRQYIQTARTNSWNKHSPK